MPSEAGSKIRAIIKVVRRTQVLCVTTAAVGIGAMTTLFFLPISFPLRIALLVPGLLVFSRKIFVIVYARQAIELLEFEVQFVSHGADPRHLVESVSPGSKLWSRSAIVRSIRGADYRPYLDLEPSREMTQRLERYLKRNFLSMMLPRANVDHVLLAVWLAVWTYLAVAHPSPSVLSATVLVISGLILFVGLSWIEVGYTIAVREQRHRLFTLLWDLTEWLFEQFNVANSGRSSPSGYRRMEYFRDNPWFSSSTKTESQKKAGGLT